MVISLLSGIRPCDHPVSTCHPRANTRETSLIRKTLFSSTVYEGLIDNIDLSITAIGLNKIRSIPYQKSKVNRKILFASFLIVSFIAAVIIGQGMVSI